MAETITDEMRQTWAYRKNFLRERLSDLTDWEVGFLDNIDTITDLTLNQSFKLGQIFRRVRDQ